MIETWGEPSSILDSSRGLGPLLESKGWKKARYGYEYLNMKESFWGSVFKERLFVVVLEQSGIEIIIVHKDMDGKLGMEWKYKVKIDKTETEWTDVKDFKNINMKQIKRDNSIDNLLND